MLVLGYLNLTLHANFTKILLKIFFKLFIKNKLNFNIYLGSNSWEAQVFVPHTVIAIGQFLLKKSYRPSRWRQKNNPGPCSVLEYYKTSVVAPSSHTMEYLSGSGSMCGAVGLVRSSFWAIFASISSCTGMGRTGPTCQLWSRRDLGRARPTCQIGVVCYGGIHMPDCWDVWTIYQVGGADHMSVGYSRVRPTCQLHGTHMSDTTYVKVIFKN
jgi:hypothetical protein